MAIGSRDPSYIQALENGVAFVGPDAVALHRATVIKVALKSYAKHGILLNRAYTPSRMLAAATEITGKKYRRRDYLVAAADLEIWCNTMKSALPVVEGK